MSERPQKHEILLESGTNELEILVFTLSGQRYGVNVAKVREVIDPPSVTGLPESHEAVVGVFQLREHVTPLIDLKRCLGRVPHADATVGKIIIMEFNDVRVGFMVDTVEQIYRLNWKDVSAMPDLAGVRDAPITSITFIKNNIVPMLDFERLVFDVGGVDLFELNAQKVDKTVTRGNQRILLAEDSRVMRNLIESNLVKSGYTNITVCQDGQDAWNRLEKGAAQEGTPSIDLLITDIEMPQMDGLHLTRRIKEHAVLKSIPVIIFSSLVSVDNEKKCRSVGADAQITKPQLDQLVSLIDRLLHVVGSAAPPEPALAAV
jgi:two-component system chemotaxis response regulator CheV